MKIQDLRYLFAYLIPFSGLHALEFQNYLVLNSFLLASILTSLFTPISIRDLNYIDQNGEQQRRTKVLFASGKNWISSKKYSLSENPRLFYRICILSKVAQPFYLKAQLGQERTGQQNNNLEGSLLYLTYTIMACHLSIYFNEVKLKAQKS